MLYEVITIPKLTNEYPNMTHGDGYAVQTELRKRFIAHGPQQIASYNFV